MDKKAAKLTVLNHLIQHSLEIVRHQTLKDLVAPIDPEPLLRDLQRRDGWPLLSGRTVLDMIDTGEIPTDSDEYTAWSDIHPQDVILTDSAPDPDAPRRWRLATQMRGNPFRQKGCPHTPS